MVTPSLNQGRFLRHAIDSVLAQTSVPVELLVMDGGSTDETLDVLATYGDRIRWVSEPDDGQSDAINKGFALCRGEILAWLNADDVYLPGAIERGVAELEHHPRADLVYGRGAILDAEGRETGPFAGIEPFNLWRLLHGLDYVLQPATFFRRAAFEAVGELDRDLHYAMDWDLWIRLAGHGEVRFIDQVLAGSREYGDTKTATGGWRRIRELARLVQRHTGRRFSPGVKLYALDTLRRQWGAALPPLAGAVDSAVAFASRRIMQATPVHADGWLGPQAALVVPRRWGSFAVTLEAHRIPSSGRFAVRFATRRGPLGTWIVERPGAETLRFVLPSDLAETFVDVRVESDFAFSTREDRRRLAVRCSELRPA